MGVVKQIDIKHRTCYFYNDFVSFKNVLPNLLNIDKKSDNGNGLYNKLIYYN